MKIYALFNPLSGRKNAKEKVAKLNDFFPNGEIVNIDVTKIDDYSSFVGDLTLEDAIVLLGGDGTLNHAANIIKNVNIPCPIYFYPLGTGNDFLNDIKEPSDKPIEITKYLNNLPVATVNGKDYVFLNGVGYGIDGYCCEVGDKLRVEKPDKDVNYTSIAIKGLLFHYKPCDATVTVDGKSYEFKKVWIAPTMFGRYYGGGMIPTPNQSRDRDVVSLMVFHGSGKLKTLMIFPKIFKGEHVKKVKNVAVLEGKEVTVKFNEPRPLQIDGETFLNVTEYAVKR